MKREKIKTIGTFHNRMRDGGTERVMSLLLPMWTDMGYEVVLFTEEPQNADDYSIDYSCVKRVVLQNDSNRAKEDYSARQEEFKVLLQENQIDIFIYHSWMSSMLPLDMKTVQKMGIPFVVYTHGVFATLFHDRTPNTGRWPLILAKADAVISLTEISARFYSLLGANAYFLPNPIDQELYHVNVKESSGQNILWIGRISEEKNPIDAIRIFSLICKNVKDATLHIVGDGNQNKLQEMKELARRLGVETAVFFEGYQSNVSTYYEQADVMLMTSSFEGYSMTLLESKAYGVPCVMYELPYLLLTKGSKGLISVPQRDVEAAAQECVAILQNEQRRKQLRIDARSDFEEKYQYKLAEEWLKIFEDIQNGRRCTEYTGGSDNDQQMLGLLLEHNEIGVNRTIEQIKMTRDYKLGQAMLKFPRKIKKYLRRGKGA